VKISRAIAAFQAGGQESGGGIQSVCVGLRLCGPMSHLIYVERQAALKLNPSEKRRRRQGDGGAPRGTKGSKGEVPWEQGTAKQWSPLTWYTHFCTAPRHSSSFRTHYGYWEYICALELIQGT